MKKLPKDKIIIGTSYYMQAISNKTEQSHNGQGKVIKTDPLLVQIDAKLYQEQEYRITIFAV